jgi:hypothetical protein
MTVRMRTATCAVSMISARYNLTILGNSSAGATGKFWTVYTEYGSESGHGLVTVTPQNVLVEFIAEGGEVIGRYTIE